MTNYKHYVIAGYAGTGTRRLYGPFADHGTAEKYAQLFQSSETFRRAALDQTGEPYSWDGAFSWSDSSDVWASPIKGHQPDPSAMLEAVVQDAKDALGLSDERWELQVSSPGQVWERSIYNPPGGFATEAEAVRVMEERAAYEARHSNPRLSYRVVRTGLPTVS